MKKNTIKFNTKQFDKVINVKKLVGVTTLTQLNKHIVYSYLTVMNYEGVLPKGYLTRVNNKNISYVSASKYVQSKLDEGFKYYIDAQRYDDNTILLGLIEAEANFPNNPDEYLLQA